MSKKDILIFGGTFDPFHYGHFSMLQKALSHLTINKVLLVPNYLCPDKSEPIIPCHERLELVTQLIPELPQRKQNKVEYECLDYEIQNKGESYTIDTIDYIVEKYPNNTYFLLVGSDNFFKFHKWKRFKDILRQVTLCIIRRDDEDKEKYEEYVYEKLHQYEFTSMIMIGVKPFNLSSTQIKQYIREGKSIKKLVPSIVNTFIKNHKDYYNI